MARVERVRELVQGSVDPQHLKQREDAGWKLAALEWQRESEGGETRPADEMFEEVSYGLRVANDCLHLEQNPEEMHILMLMLDLIVQDHPLSRVASALNERGFTTRQGRRWSAVSVFNMLPRLIEAGPKIFSTEEWEARKGRLDRIGAR
jgi:hypothetical protein